MNFDWVLLAEGIGQDSKGAITAIGINQNVLLAGKLPTTTKRALIAHFVDRDSKIHPKSEFTFTINVIGPRGNVEVAQTVQGEFNENPLGGLPVGVDLPVQFMIPIRDYGDYRITVQLKVEDAEVKGETALYVRPLPSER